MEFLGRGKNLANFRLKAHRQIASEVLDPGNRKTKLSEIKVHHDEPQIAAGKTTMILPKLEGTESPYDSVLAASIKVGAC